MDLSDGRGHQKKKSVLGWLVAVVACPLVYWLLAAHVTARYMNIRANGTGKSASIDKILQVMCQPSQKGLHFVQFHGGAMTPDAHMEFQLAQAKLRAVIATLSVVCGVVLPFLGFLGYHSIDKMDAASSAVGRLTTEIAVLNTQMTYLREDIGDLQRTVKILHDRAHKALYIVEGPHAKTYVPTGSRVSSESDFGQAWAASLGVHGFSNLAYGGFASRKSEEGGA